MNDENLIKHQYKKGGRSLEENQRIGRLGGLESGRKRRERATLKKALERALNGKPDGKMKQALVKLGYDPDDISNADAIMSVLISMAVQGNAKAMEMLLNYQFQVAEDERKREESKARIAAMKQNHEGIQIESEDDDDGGVVIYLPALDEDPEEAGQTAKEEAPEGVVE